MGLSLILARLISHSVQTPANFSRGLNRSELPPGKLFRRCGRWRWATTSRWHWADCFRHNCSAVTSKASNVYFSIGEFGVDFFSHSDHVPADFLLRVFIAGKVALNMAMRALDSQCNTILAHGGRNINGGNFQDFQVLRRTRWTALFLPFIWGLGE